MTESLLTRLGNIYTEQQAAELLNRLIAEIDWQKDYIAFGRCIDIPRWQAWVADPGIKYRYSDNLLKSSPWNEYLKDIKTDIERECGHEFNSVLVTYYRDGFDHVTWHADDEIELGDEPFIASLSLGATRDFLYRHKQTGDVRNMTLHSGELLLMQPVFQHDWEHCIPEQVEISEPRINLTFRKVVMD